MSYASRFACPYCGAPIRVRWWRKLGHRFRYPIFGLLYLGTVVERLMATPRVPEADERPRSYFFVECRARKKHIPVPEGG